MNLKRSLFAALALMVLGIISLFVFKHSDLNSKSKSDFLREQPDAYLCKQEFEKVDSDHFHVSFIYSLSFAPNVAREDVWYYTRKKNGAWQAILKAAATPRSPPMECRMPSDLIDNAPTRMTYAPKSWERQELAHEPESRLQPQAHPQPTELFERSGDKIIAASAAVLALARTYREFKYKGEVVNGVRKTIMTRKRSYKIGEPVRVIHVFESVQYGPAMSTMGPEPICSEFVDGRHVEYKSCSGSRSIGWGYTRNPTVNFNFDISTFRFDEPGIHTIRWKSHGFEDARAESNLIKIYVEPK